MTSQQIRRDFIEFFQQKHAHAFVPSSPVVPHDDPTLLFTNAGMNQFKPIFLGQEKRDYTRAVNTQKCIRAGGKHNDLDDVGRSRRHHTFFEMLGNWSFGDYFKAGAIEMAWELLTRVWKLDPERLHVTCYEGNEAAGIPRDTEAAELWKKIAGLPDDRIHYFGAKDNFWEMGDTGPCGPCTEINVDRRPQAEIDADKAAGRRAPVNGDDPRVMEIWNLVFIQFNRTWKTGGESAVRQFDNVKAGPLVGEDVPSARDRVRQTTFGTTLRSNHVGAHTVLDPLPAQHVDTGMGLERICQVIQGKDDNYGTDLWTPLFDKLAELSGKKYAGKFPPTNSVDPAAEAADEQLRQDIAFRVVADHARCLTFALSDGGVPSNEGRGYVLRRILRRAAFWYFKHLPIMAVPSLYKLVPVIVDSMGDAFPELKTNPKHVSDLIKEEEISFGRTLDRGVALFNDAAAAAALESPDGHVPPGRVRMIPAADAFKLHDTYGFPIDLTRIMAEERGMSVDIAGYEKLMEQAKELARSGGKTDDAAKKLTDLSPAALSALAESGVKPTDDRAKYGREPVTATVMGIWNGDDLGLSPASAAEDEPIAVIVDRTNFYAEMGGQTGDTGTLTGLAGVPASAGTTVFDVETTKPVGGYTLHIGRVRTGKIEVGQTVTATVAPARRTTEQNHTTTHLANWALREVLGEGVQQKGSLVDADKLRFDFSHGKALGDDELEKVESLVNARIKESLPVYAEEAPQELALKINGLRAVFGEKYPPMVRVVSIGAPVRDLLADPGNAKWREYSVEFCGGTHLTTTADAKHFAVIAEESVSKGIRRLVAVTGAAASAATEAARHADDLIIKAKAGPDDQLATAIAALNQAITAGTLPLRAKRRAQAAVTELQSRSKAFEKSNKSKSAGTDAVTAAADLLAAAPALGPGKLVVGEIANASDDGLRAAMDSIKSKSSSYGVMLAAATDGRVTFVAAVSDDLIALGLKAGDWIRETAKAAGGNGGGRPQMAQAGGKDPAKLPDALATAVAFARSKVDSQR